jgi:hypothetical protein
MATVPENKTVLAGGGNGGRVVAGTPNQELEKAQDVARRYRCQFVDLHNFQLHHELFKKIPVHLMFRYNFVPLEETEDGRGSQSIDDDRRDQLAAGQAHRHQSFDAGANQRDP